ncbi:hypothetical protein NL676_012964 [Syzygium grande]|nr:hypothetical protein NL676_012964 [Syzygium grande]
MHPQPPKLRSPSRRSPPTPPSRHVAPGGPQQVRASISGHVRFLWDRTAQIPRLGIGDIRGPSMKAIGHTAPAPTHEATEVHVDTRVRVLFPPEARAGRGVWGAGTVPREVYGLCDRRTYAF